MLFELLGCGLQQWKENDKYTEVRMYRNRNSDFLQYFIITCIDVSGLMFRLSITQKAEEWRLFIDSSKNTVSLNSVLLLNDKELPSVPVAYVVAIKETYETMCHILQAIKY